MPKQKAYYVRNTGPDILYRHGSLVRLLGDFLMMAPGITVSVERSQFLWPHGAIVLVPWEVWALTPALGKQPWAEEVTFADFCEEMRKWAMSGQPAEETGAKDETEAQEALPESPSPPTEPAEEADVASPVGHRRGRPRKQD